MFVTSPSRNLYEYIRYCLHSILLYVYFVYIYFCSIACGVLFTCFGLFNVCMRVFLAPNATILLEYIPAKIKMNFIWKYDFFLPKSAFSVSRSQAHLAKRCSSVYTTIFVRLQDKTNYRSNQTWAKCYHSRNKQ